MGGAKLTLRVDSASIPSILAQVSALAERSSDFAHALCRLIESGEELVRVDGEPFAAPGTGHLSVRIAPTQALADLLAATWAVDGDGGESNA